MSKDKAHKPAAPPAAVPVPKEFSDGLVAAVEGAGVKWNDFVEGAGADPSASGWRFRNGGGSIKMANQFIDHAEKLVKQKGLSIAIPTLVARSTEEMAEWVALGDRLRRLSPDLFAKRRDAIRALVEQIENSSSDDLDGALHPTSRK